MCSGVCFSTFKVGGFGCLHFMHTYNPILNLWVKSPFLSQSSSSPPPPRPHAFQWGYLRVEKNLTFDSKYFPCLPKVVHPGQTLKYNRQACILGMELPRLLCHLVQGTSWYLSVDTPRQLEERLQVWWNHTIFIFRICDRCSTRISNWCCYRCNTSMFLVLDSWCLWWQSCNTSIILECAMVSVFNVPSKLRKCALMHKFLAFSAQFFGSVHKHAI